MDRAEESEDGLGRHHRTASGQADSAVPDPVDLAGYVLDEQFGFLLRQMQQRYVAMFLEMMGEDGPTPPQFAVLCRLAVDGRISQNQLGRMTAMDPATIRGVVTRLAERGLVERLHDPDDKRGDSDHYPSILTVVQSAWRSSHSVPARQARSSRPPS